MDECDPSTPIPSLSWFRMAFAPQNKRHESRFTGRLQVKRMVQQRQLHANHVDTHYASAIFRYVASIASLCEHVECVRY